jgi:transposase InsO family protein
VASVEKIAEACLVPALELILDGFPFLIKGFHSDNGSEFVNHRVVKLLNKMLIRFTKSRPRHTNDNALVESKNGSVIRKHLGYAHIPQRYARYINAYYEEFFNLYINFHRPCFFPVTIVDHKGKMRKKYPYEEVMTPYERLKSLAKTKGLLAPGVTWAKLDAIANQMSDNEFAVMMVKARSDLFEQIPGFGGGLPEAVFVSYPHIHKKSYPHFKLLKSKACLKIGYFINIRNLWKIHFHKQAKNFFRKKKQFWDFIIFLTSIY